MTQTALIESIIQQAIPDAWVIVHNINNDGSHFEAVVISATFNGLSVLKQHQRVMRPLQEAFETAVHALALKTFSRDSWNETQHNYSGIAQKIKEKYSDII
jgi:acid stress-induced BolA-like protein IbaG/YrbA